MKKSLLKLLIMSSRLILITTVIQLFTYNVLFGHIAMAQMDAVINKDLSSKSVKQILHIIEKETDLNFIYDRGKTNVDRNITISGKGNTVKAILDKMTSELNLSFKVINNTVTVIQPNRIADTFNQEALLKDAGSQMVNSVSGQLQVRGVITDRKTGEPLAGVSVKVKGTANGTSTDAKGEFSISAPDDATLVITYIGYETKEVSVNGKTALSITLEQSSSQLLEVVVLGYQTATKRSVTTSIASVSSKEIKSYVTGNVANALQGKIPGVMISPGSGLPGSQPTIMIRGLSSLTGNTTPLIIVDGNEMGYNSLNFINPADIESVDVLKDASAAAIYGSRAGQGVILITTKRGKGKPSINVESSIGFDNLPDPKIADVGEYVRVMNTIATNSGVPLYFPNTNIQGTNYWDRTFDTGVRQNYNVSASGGKEGLSLYGNLGYYKQDSYNATDKGGNWEKITARFNADLNLSKVFKMGLSFAPRYEKWLNSPNNTWNAFSMDPTTAPLKTEEDVYSSIPAGFMNFTAFNPTYSLPNRSAFANINNPEFNYITNFGQNDAFGAQYGTYIQAAPIKNLILKSTIEGFATSTSSTDYSPKYFLATNAFSQTATVSGSTQTNMRWKFTNTANYKFDFADHHFDLLAGQSIDNYTVKGTSATKQDIPFDQEAYRYLSGAATLTGGSGYYQEGAAPFGKMLSYFGSLRYNFRDKYYLSGTMRADASSLVNPDYRWGYFPTLSAGWIVSDEPFFEPLSNKVNTLKLRASWGRAGGNLPTEVGAYMSLVSP
ncbi:MAG TPA: SusC/RagA family TonB-linked outer membrane protein, partial [Sphingobacteriaceae bacterium]